MRRGPIQQRAVGDDSGRVDVRMRGVVVALDVVEVRCVPEGRQRVQVTRVAPQVRVVGQPAQVDLEVVVVDRVKPGQGDPEPDVGLGDRVTEQVPAAGQALLQIVQGGEDLGYRVVVGLLGDGHARAVHAVVHGLIDDRVDRVDLGTQGLRVQVHAGGERAELGIQVDRDVGEVVADDPAGLPVPQHRDGDVPVVAGLGGLVGLAQQREPVDRVQRVPGALAERPAAAVPDRVNR
jgi:hypothetical protein